MPATVSILGCGWLGLPLARALVAKGYVVNGSTTSASKIPELENAGITPFVIHLDQPDTHSNLHSFLNSDCLVIAVPPRAKTQPNYPQQILSLREHIEKSSIQKVIFISSTSVYPATNSIVTEDFSGTPETTSGKMLQHIEHQLMACQHFDTVVLRMAGLYGYDRQPGRFLAGKKNLPNAEAPINLIHQDDCVAILLEVIAQNTGNIILNCVADKHPTRKAFYTQAAKKAGLDIPVFSTDPPLLSYKIIDNSKLKQVLAYTFSHPDPMADL